MNKILAVVAHPDDEVIGLGGTLLKHTRSGDEVAVLILGDGKSSRFKKYKKLGNQVQTLSLAETKAALRLLHVKKFWKESLPDNRFDRLEQIEIAKIISSYVSRWQSTIVYTHHYGDLNIDHRMTAEGVLIACRPIENSVVKSIYLFETLSSTEMSGYNPHRAFLPNMFVDISAELPTKLRAMSSYKSELHDFPHPRSLAAIEYNARLWGAKNNIDAAEAFFCVRDIKSTR